MSSDPKIEALNAEPAETALRGFFARLFTVLLLIIIPAMVIHIGFRWATVKEPTTAVLFSGDGSLDGASVVVWPVSDAHARLTATLDQSDGWQAPVLLDPGRYHVVVTHRGHKILDDDCEPDRMMGVRFQLPSMVMIIGDASLAGAQIEVRQRKDKSIAYEFAEIKLTPENQYRTPIHLHTGDYQVIATKAPASPKAAAEVVRRDFTVDRTETVRVDISRRAMSNID